MAPVIDIADARALVLQHCGVLPPVSMPFRAAIGTVLAAEVVAGEDVPPFANSAVDGYAVRAESVQAAPVELPVVAEVAAGAFTDHVLQPGEAIRIMTGAPVPDGTDAVVMVEDTERLDGGTRVRVLKPVDAGSAVRAAASGLEGREAWAASRSPTSPQAPAAAACSSARSNRGSRWSAGKPARSRAAAASRSAAGAS